MLRKTQKALLAELGLDHLADSPVTMHRFDGKLHRANPCPHFTTPPGYSAPSDADPSGVEVVTTPREIDEPRCTCTWGHPELVDITEVGTLARILNSFPRKAVPEGKSLQAMSRITQIMMALEQTRDMFSYGRFKTSNPLVLAAVTQKQEEVEEQHAELRQLLLEHGSAASREYALAEEIAHLGPVADRLREALRREEARQLTSAWRNLIYRGYDREKRRRLMSKITGGICLGDLRTYGTEDEIAKALPYLEAVQGIVEELEDALEERKSRTPVLQLATLEERSSTYSSGVSRVAVESFTVATSGRTRLLVLPADSYRAFQYTEISAFVEVPENPELLETVAKLWEGDADSIFSDPNTVLKAAELL